jgi:hypothetical protein
MNSENVNNNAQIINAPPYSKADDTTISIKSTQNKEEDEIKFISQSPAPSRAAQSQQIRAIEKQVGEITKLEDRIIAIQTQVKIKTSYRKDLNAIEVKRQKCIGDIRNISERINVQKQTIGKYIYKKYLK